MKLVGMCTFDKVGYGSLDGAKALAGATILVSLCDCCISTNFLQRKAGA